MRAEESDIESWFEDERERIQKGYHHKLKLLFDTTGDFLAEELAAKKKKKSVMGEEEEVRIKKPQMTETELQLAMKRREQYKRDYEQKLIALRAEYDRRYNKLWSRRKLEQKYKKGFMRIFWPFIKLWEYLVDFFTFIAKTKDYLIRIKKLYDTSLGIKVNGFFYHIFHIKLSIFKARIKRWHSLHTMKFTEIFMGPLRFKIKESQKAYALYKETLKKQTKSLVENLKKHAQKLLTVILWPLKKALSAVKSVISAVKSFTDKIKGKYKSIHDRVFGGGDDPFS